MKFNTTIFTGLSLIFVTGIVRAQEVKIPEKTEKTISEEIEIIRPYKPILAEAVKLRRSPDLDNIKTYKAKFNYQLSDNKLALNSDIQKLQAQKIAMAQQAALVNNYAKVG